MSSHEFGLYLFASLGFNRKSVVAKFRFIYISRIPITFCADVQWKCSYTVDYLLLREEIVTLSALILWKGLKQFPKTAWGLLLTWENQSEVFLAHIGVLSEDLLLTVFRPHLYWPVWARKGGTIAVWNGVPVSFNVIGFMLTAGETMSSSHGWTMSHNGVFSCCLPKHLMEKKLFFLDSIISASTLL